MGRFARVLGILLLACSHAGALQLTAQEAAGKQLFTQGTSAGGGDVTALVGASGAQVPAAVVPCANCHGRDGRGRPEGGVRPPDITWRKLITPYSKLASNGRSHPAYTDSTVARAVTHGMDPAGNKLDPAMPRFVMSMRDMSDLTAYLKRLEEERDPGVEDNILRIGTVLPLQGPFSALGKTVAQVLKGAVEEINQAGGIHGRQLQLLIADAGNDRQSAEASLRNLLEQHQVFALVAPLAPALDGHYAELLEATATPLIGPLELRSQGRQSRLIFAPLPGVVEQLQALGKFAEQSLKITPRNALIVAEQSPDQQVMAQLLQARLQQDGWSQVNILPYQRDRLDGVIERAGPVSSVFFFGLSHDFAQLAESLDTTKRHPYLFAASAQVASSALALPDGFDQRVFLAYPFAPSDWTEEGVQALTAARSHSELGSQNGALQVSAYCAALLLGEGLRRAGRDVSREKLITELEGLHNFHTGLTPVLSFGPGQRVGALGAHIVQVDSDAQKLRATGQYISVDSGL